MQKNKIKQFQEKYDDVCEKLNGLTLDFNKEKINIIYVMPKLLMRKIIMINKKKK